VVIESQATIESDAENSHRVRHQQVDIRHWYSRRRWHRCQLYGCAHDERFRLVWIQLDSVDFACITACRQRREWTGWQLCCRRASLGGAECRRRIDSIGRHWTRWHQRLDCNDAKVLCRGILTSDEVQTPPNGAFCNLGGTATNLVMSNPGTVALSRSVHRFHRARRGDSEGLSSCLSDKERYVGRVLW